MVRGATHAKTRLAWSNVLSVTTMTGRANGKAGDAQQGCRLHAVLGKGSLQRIRPVPGLGVQKDRVARFRSLSLSLMKIFFPFLYISY